MKTQEEMRIAIGWQCPECYSAKVECKRDRFGSKPSFQCQECGCQYSEKLEYAK